MIPCIQPCIHDEESAEHDGSIVQIPHFIIVAAIQRQAVSDIHEHLSKQVLTTPMRPIAPPVIMMSVVSIMPAKPDAPDSVERRTLNQGGACPVSRSMSARLLFAAYLRSHHHIIQDVLHTRKKGAAPSRRLVCRGSPVRDRFGIASFEDVLDNTPEHVRIDAVDTVAPVEVETVKVMEAISDFLDLILGGPVVVRVVDGAVDLIFELVHVNHGGAFLSIPVGLALYFPQQLLLYTV